MTPPSNDPKSVIQSGRLLIAGLVAVIVVLGLGIVLLTIGRSEPTEQAVSGPSERVNVLADRDDDCVACHSKTTPGIVEQYGHSSMAAAEVSCQNCHEVEEGYPGSVAHEGTFVLNQPTTAMCAKCHASEVAQFNQSRHGLPAYVAMVGAEDLSADLLEIYESIPEGGYKPDRARNALFKLEGPEITRFACEGCHNIGKPAADGSVGECTACHLRHEFSLEQVRKPETCNACHIQEF